MFFTEWLEQQETFQREAYGTRLNELEETDRLRYIDDMLRAAILEVAEAYDEFSWKSWSSAQFRNQDALTSELVDVLFFVANALVANGVTTEQLAEKYRSKMAINTQRQLDGYDGVSTKCPNCKRALDDTAVTCTLTQCAEEV